MDSARRNEDFTDLTSIDQEAAFVFVAQIIAPRTTRVHESQYLVSPGRSLLGLGRGWIL